MSGRSSHVQKGEDDLKGNNIVAHYIGLESSAIDTLSAQLATQSISSRRVVTSFYA